MRLNFTRLTDAGTAKLGTSLARSPSIEAISLFLNGNTISDEAILSLGKDLAMLQKLKSLEFVFPRCDHDDHDHIENHLKGLRVHLSGLTLFAC